jgi:hypothetical protein
MDRCIDNAILELVVVIEARGIEGGSCITACTGVEVGLVLFENRWLECSIFHA